MARDKNALRRHLVAEYEPGVDAPSEEEYLELAKWITDIEDSTDETTEDYADYAGDGTQSLDVTGFREAYDVTGTYDPEDEAQALIASKKRKLGVGRKIWHKIISANGAEEVEGVATVSAIVAGSGNAADFQAFGCNIAFDTIPEVVSAPEA